MKKSKIIGLIASIALLIVTSILLYTIYKTLSDNEKQIEKSTSVEVGKADLALANYLNRCAKLVDSVRTQIVLKNIIPDNIENEFQKIMETNTDLFRISASYEPFKFDKKKKLHCSKVYRGRKGLKFINDSIRDYTGLDWYKTGLKSKSEWINPYVDTISKNLILSHAVQLFANKKDMAANQNPIGVVDIDFKLTTIHKILSTIKIGNTGFGFIVSDSGLFISHSNEDLVREQRKVKDVLKFPRYEHYRIINEILKKKNPEICTQSQKVSNKSTKEESWVSICAIQGTHWYFVVMFPTDETQIDLDKMRKLLLWTIIFAVAFLLSTSFLLYKPDNSNNNWILSAYSSFSILAGMMCIWFIASDMVPSESKRNIKIFDNANLIPVKRKIEKELKGGRVKSYLLIPTGIYVKSMDFSSSDEVRVSGLVWEKYTDSSKIAHSIYFPDAIQSTIEKNYINLNIDSSYTVGWNFDITLRLGFDYSKYPFDLKDINIAMKHDEYYKNNYVLIPDLASYQVTYPTAKPGLDPKIIFSDWSIEKSYFNLSRDRSQTNLGIDDDFKYSKNWNLNYTINIKRYILQPFISILLPFFVILILLFTVLYIIEDAPRKDFVSSAAALFFTVLLSHFSLRQGLKFKEVVYFEYFYFTLYFLIILLVINSIIFHTDATDSKFREMLKHKENLLIKILFWPFTLALLLLITVVIFY